MRAMSPARAPSTRQLLAKAADAEASLLALPPGVAAILRDSWRECGAAPGDFAEDLYANLFALAPAVAALFPADLGEQRGRLTHTLNECIALLDRPADLLQLLKASGVRHLHYRTEFAHFPLLGQAFTQTLRQRLGTRFAPAIESAWTLLYQTMTAIMAGAMAGANAERA
jgi:hemoglobin-like flavoprotein